MYTGIRRLGRDATQSSDISVEVLKLSATSLIHDITVLMLTLAITAAVATYLVFLWFLPQILGIGQSVSLQGNGGGTQLKN